MSAAELEKLKQQYVGQRVLVDARRPELARLADVPGRVVTINCNGRALVQFDWADVGWHDRDVDLFVFHQANEKLISYFMHKMDLPMSRTYSNVAEIGNLGVASVPVALADVAEKSLLHHGDKLVLASVGAGFGFGASAWTWCL